MNTGPSALETFRMLRSLWEILGAAGTLGVV